MNEKIKDGVIVELSVPTVFPDYNTANNLPADHALTNLKVGRLKYKHLRIMQSVAEENQMHEALSKLTGLTHNDLDELDAEDAAEITSVVYGFMSKFMKLSSKLSGGGER